MTTAAARAAFETAEMAFDLSCAAIRRAENAWRRSRSQANRDALASAREDFETMLATVTAAREAYEAAARRDEIAERLAARAERRGPANLQLFG